jgi:site-specific DNA-cytosine methylase
MRFSPGIRDSGRTRHGMEEGRKRGPADDDASDRAAHPKDSGTGSVNFHPEPQTQPTPVKAVIPLSLGTRSQRINPWIPADRPAATICKNDAGYELKEAQLKPSMQSYRVLTGQERGKHFGLIRVDPEKPCPTIQKSQPESSTTGLIHPCEVRHLTISEVKLMSLFPAGFRIEGRFTEKWARLGNSVPPLFMRSIANHIRTEILQGTGRTADPLEG